MRKFLRKQVNNSSCHPTLQWESCSNQVDANFATNFQANKQTKRQTNRQMDRQLDRQLDRVKQTRRCVAWPIIEQFTPRHGRTRQQEAAPGRGIYCIESHAVAWLLICLVGLLTRVDNFWTLLWRCRIKQCVDMAWNAIKMLRLCNRNTFKSKSTNINSWLRHLHMPTWGCPARSVPLRWVRGSRCFFFFRLGLGRAAWQLGTLHGNAGKWNIVQNARAQTSWVSISVWPLERERQSKSVCVSVCIGC